MSRDEEYHFSETPKTPAVFTASGVAANPAAHFFEKITRKNILGGMAVMLVVLIVYKVGGSLLSSSNRTAAEVPKPVVKAVVPPPKVVQPTPPPVVSAPAPQPVVAAAPAPAGPNPVESELQSKLNKNEEAVTQLTSNVTALQEQLVNVNNALQTVLEQSKQQQAALAALQKTRVHRVANAAEKTAAYYVTAAIHGRAWLVDNRGVTTTISLGDQLPTYGTVLDINPDKGIVVTSSGEIIRYQPADR